MFTTQYDQILATIDAIDPIKYAKTRNYLNGAVTKLSPYISRGVISTQQIAKSVLAKGYKSKEIEPFLKELAWRDYFQQVWHEKGDRIDDDLKQPQSNVENHLMPKNILAANTQIQAIDKAIQSFYEMGYMHNHMRMYVASMCCNIAKSHWRNPAKWMYYHLLDADWASNALSWQWVVGSFSHKKYYANQENINKYCNSHQIHTFLDIPYEDFKNTPIPKSLQELISIDLKTNLPQSNKAIIDTELPVFVYNFYNLDCKWEQTTKANRILLLEPSFFKKHPVSDGTIHFILNLSKNIENIQVVVGEFQEVFDKIHYKKIHYKEHPTATHYKGTKHEREWLFPQIKGYFPSFFAYWKKCEKQKQQTIVD